MFKFNPLVSIIIPVYNGGKYLRKAIDSALNQTYENIEIIVVNDGSDDKGETEKTALSYGSKIKYFSKYNGGVASALNLGINKMKGEYFSWLSHDDMYFRNKISEQIKLLSALKDKTTLIFSGWVVIDSNGKEIHRILPLSKYTQKQLKTPLFALIHGQINGCSLLIHKKHFEREGMFNEQLPTTQDFDLWFRIMRGNKAVCYPGVLSMTRVHGGQGSKTSANAHSAESDAFWISMMETLTEQEKIDVAGTLYNFYKNVYFQLMLYSTSHKAKDYAKKRAIAERKSVVGISGCLCAMELFLSSGIIFLWEFLLSIKKTGIRNTAMRVSLALKRVFE